MIGQTGRKPRGAATDEALSILAAVSNPEETARRLEELREATARYETMHGVHETLEAAEYQLHQAREQNEAAKVKLDRADDDAARVRAQAESDAVALRNEAQDMIEKARVRVEASQDAMKTASDALLERERAVSRRESECERVARDQDERQAGLDAVESLWRDRVRRLQAVIDE